MLPRSLLFVPANRPERYQKALDSGADQICIDLEDSIPSGEKEAARNTALSFIATETTSPKALRINAINSLVGLADLMALAQLPELCFSILIPKVGHPREIQLVEEVLGEVEADLSLLALLETSEGIANAPQIAQRPQVKALLFGSADWSTETGADMGWDSLLTPRSLIVQAAAQAGIQAIDGVWVDLDDLDGLYRETRRIKQLGFVGRAILHPKQIGATHNAFMPSDTEISYAKQVIQAFEGRRQGLAVVKGRMIDKPLLEAAQRTMAIAAINTEGTQ